MLTYDIGVSYFKLQYIKSGNSVHYTLNMDSALTEIKYMGQKPWKADVSLNSAGKYIITHQDLENSQGVFLHKYEIKFMEMAFSEISPLINFYALPGSANRYLLPFFSKKLLFQSCSFKN